MLVAPPTAPRRPVAPTLNPLDERAVPAVLAVFNTDTLTVTGDGKDNNITVAADAAGNVTVTDGSVPVFVRVLFGTPTTANLKTVDVDAGRGDDSITLSKSLNVLDANGKLAAAPNASLRGGAGNDTITPLTGGFLGGVIGNPIIGNVTQDGGSGDDFLDSGFGNDTMIGGSGNDTLRWLPGTLIDTFEGGSGQDTAIVVGNGNNQGDAFVLSADGPGRALFQRTNLVPFFISMGSMETVNLQTDTGDDTITVNDLTGSGVKTVVADGGAGNDTITAAAQGSKKVSLVAFGGDGNDAITGGAGNDLLSGGAGDDTLTGGKGFDVLYGGDGSDTLDGTKDGTKDVLIGGDGADTFTRYQNGTKVNKEFELDVTAEDVVVVK